MVRSGRHRFFAQFKPYQLWRYLILNLKILRGVDRSKRLKPFVIKYKVSYLVPDSDTPSAIANTSKPPSVGDLVQLACQQVEILEVRQPMRPRGEFCFLEAICRPVADAPGAS